jgi:hypothetical protein
MSVREELIGLLSQLDQIGADARSLLVADAGARVDALAENVSILAERMHDTVNELIRNADDK